MHAASRASRRQLGIIQAEPIFEAALEIAVADSQIRARRRRDLFDLHIIVGRLTVAIRIEPDRQAAWRSQGQRRRRHLLPCAIAAPFLFGVLRLTEQSEMA